MPHQTYISPHSQQVLLHLLTYAHTHKDTRWHLDYMPCTKALVSFVTTMLYVLPQTYTIMSSQHQLDYDQPRQSLLYFSELHILFSHSILHEEATLVRNMLQPTNTTDTQCAESARTMSTQYSTLETMYHTSADSLTTGPCLPQGWKSVLLVTQHTATQTCRVHTTYNKQHTYTQHMHRTQMICTSYHHQWPSSTLSMGGSRRGQNGQLMWTQWTVNNTCITSTW